MTETATVVEPATNLPMVKFSIPDAAIEDLRDRLEGRTAETNEGYVLVMKGLAETRKIRVAIEKKRKELKADSLQWGRNVDGEAKRLTSSIVEIEKPLLDSRAEADAKQEAIERAERERVEAEKQAKEEAERQARLAQEAAERQARLAQEAAERQARLAQEAIERAERKRVEKVVRAKERAEHESAIRQQREEAERVAKETAQKLMQSQVRLAQEAIERAERERVEAERQAKEEAERQVRLAQEAIERAERIKEEEKRESADFEDFKAEIWLLKNWATEIGNIVTPKATSEYGAELVHDSLLAIEEALYPVWDAIKNAGE